MITIYVAIAYETGVQRRFKIPYLMFFVYIFIIKYLIRHSLMLFEAYLNVYNANAHLSIPLANSIL